MSVPYVPLHLHTEFSLLDGAIRLKKLCDFAKENNMPAVAITDHGVMYGAMEFCKIAKEAGVKADKNGLKILLTKTEAELGALGLTEAQIAALMAQKAAQDAVNSSMLANPVMWIVAGLAALVAITTAVINA